MTVRHDDEDPDELLTLDELVEWIKVPRSTIAEWAAKREAGDPVGPPLYSLSVRNRRWRRGDVASWIDSRRH